MALDCTLKNTLRTDDQVLVPARIMETYGDRIFVQIEGYKNPVRVDSGKVVLLKRPAQYRLDR